MVQLGARIEMESGRPERAGLLTAYDGGQLYLRRSANHEVLAVAPISEVRAYRKRGLVCIEMCGTVFRLRRRRGGSELEIGLSVSSTGPLREPMPAKDVLKSGGRIIEPAAFNGLVLRTIETFGGHVGQR